jgi:predicted O-linked N-acetylglucosamine transferase (SPINDLY family)
MLWNNLGEAFRVEERFESSADCFRQALRLDPRLAAAHLNLGNVLRAMRKTTEAVECFRSALQLQPNYAKAHCNLSSLYLEQQLLDEALFHGQAAIRSDPSLAEAQANMSSVEYQLGNLSAAIRFAREALRGKPNLAAAHNMLGTALQDQGDADAALACFQQALVASDPHERPRTHSNLLFCLQHCSQITPPQLLAAHRSWESAYASNLAGPRAPLTTARRASTEPLRVGLVSADLGCHPVGQFVVGWLEHLDRRRIEIYCYSDRPIEDLMSQRLQSHVAGRRDVQSLDDETLAGAIREDGIDILCDLAGHTRGNRLRMFARRVAPIQATWMGYVGTTGLSTIDFLIADERLVPTGEEQNYCEQIVRLPDGWLCYSPADAAPEVSAPPCRSSGNVTFGCFNNCSKINPQTINAWAEILRRLPDSRLLLKFKWYGDPGVRERYARQFMDQGIAADRIEMLGWTPQAEHLASYSRIDLALDTFPYTGGVTTCEALLMGVPVVSCVGKTFASRQSFSHLYNVGLTELCAFDWQQYVERAVEWASDRQRLKQTRASLRQRLLASPLGDAPRFARQLTSAFETMGQRLRP